MTTRVTITNSTDANTANAYPNEHHIEIFESFPTQDIPYGWRVLAPGETIDINVWDDKQIMIREKRKGDL